MKASLFKVVDYGKKKIVILNHSAAIIQVSMFESFLSCVLLGDASEEFSHIDLVVMQFVP